MKIAFFYEHGKIKEIGTGHKYRSVNISDELRVRGHTTWMLEDNLNYEDADVVVIDHIFSQLKLIEQIKQKNKKVVLIDGHTDDVDMVDVSISAIYNNKAKYYGIKYMAIPKHNNWERYRAYTNSNLVFVGLGGFDYNNYTEVTIQAILDLGFKALIAPNINYNIPDKYMDYVIVSNDSNYYNIMKNCILGVVNGGLTLFQALHYGLPCVAIPQYSHQIGNIATVQHCCVPGEPNRDDIGTKLKWLLDRVSFREDISYLAQNFIDGQGINRICNLIEEL